jgi:putative endopeptidase
MPPRAPLLAATIALLALAADRGVAQTPDSTRLLPLKVVDLGMVDTTAGACTDFFQYATGTWLARDTIPPDYSSSGVGRDMADRNELVVRSVLEDASASRRSAAPGSTLRKLGTFYGTCMDSAAVERQGLDPMRPLLKAVDRISTRAGLIRQAGALQRQGVDALFSFFPQPDAHDAAHYQAWFYQGGLGMPDRDYYTKAGASSDSLRQAYVAHIAKYLAMAGATEAAAARDAGRIMSLETEMAKASLTRVEQRDPLALDHPTSRAELHALMPGIDWPAYFASVGMTVPINTVNVAMPTFFGRLDSLLATVPLADWRAYLRFHILASAAPMLSTPWIREDFAFRSRFSGAKALLPRWKRCLRRTDGQIGEALGEAYVAKAFSPEARAGAKEVIDNIRAAFGERLDHLSWMSEATRQAAHAKLAGMGEKVGYPDKWRDYTRLVVKEGPFVLNAMQADLFEWDRQINRPGMPVDTTEWGITVPTVNAYYDPSKNEMVFPAGALVPQTYDPAADDGANYGSLGASWAGHELTHGFDDEGRHYDAAGNLREWWTPEDSVHFSEQAARIVQQYDGYVQVDTFHVNGRLTEGENIADYGGVLVGYDALQRALERHGRPGLIEGYTPEQRFFLAYAQSFRTNVRPEQLRTWVTTNPHSPERWRVNGPLSDVEAFARAFGCKAGDPMVRPRDLVPDIW